MSRFDLVIFDCDGVLIDSERLAIRTESNYLLNWAGHSLKRKSSNSSSGARQPICKMVIEEKLGRAIDWHHEFERREREVYERELVPVEGVIAALEEITLPSCVASSSSHEMLRFKLGLTGLAERFSGRLFSADDVAHAKPDPAVFLFAARRWGCVLIGAR